MKRLPSDHYFRTVETVKDYQTFIMSGMSWEWEPECPESWAEHCRLKEVWLEHKAYDGT